MEFGVRSLITSTGAQMRLRRAADWLAQRRPSERVLVVGASLDAASELLRTVAAQVPAAFGWERLTLGRLAALVAAGPLRERELSPLSPLGVEAVCARLIHQLGARGQLGRFQPVWKQPGLARALARTLQELRMAGVRPCGDLAQLLDAYETELLRARLADRAEVFRLAVDGTPGSPHPLLARPTLLLDVPLHRELEACFVARLSADVLATAPTGDNRSIEHLSRALHIPAEQLDEHEVSSLARVQKYLFVEGTAPSAPAGDDVAILSAPGESRECIEIVRLVKNEGERGVPFDRMAVLLRAPSHYRALLEEAFARADIPVHFAQGAVRPDPAGRAFLALLACAAERLSARRFAEYLSLGEAPNAVAGAPPPPPPRGDRWVPPDTELSPPTEPLSEEAEHTLGSRTETEGDRTRRVLAPPSDALTKSGHGSSARTDAAPEEMQRLSPSPTRASNESGRTSSPQMEMFFGQATSANPPATVASKELGGTSARSVSEEAEPLPQPPTAPSEESASFDLLSPHPHPSPRGRGDSEPVVAGSLRAPWRWEQMILDAAVIGGRDRWERRLAGLERVLETQIEALADEEARVARVRRDLDDLRALREFALPLLDALQALRREATWGEWLDDLSALATRAVRDPARILSVLAELAPMSPVGPVTLDEVRLVLSERLTELSQPATGNRYGKVFVAPVDAARGLSFDVVFVPGLAEKLFPQKVVQDPLLRDLERAELPGLDTSDDRVLAERLALRLAAGAAHRKLVLSWPRLDAQQARARVPSFYGLEVMRAAEGTLPGFSELMRRAEQVGAARIGWPAPVDPSQAIDEAEHDLSLLQRAFRAPDRDRRGTGHYLLRTNPHLARALRARARRWIKRWTPADGLVEPTPEALAALAAHLPAVRPFSPTALQDYASCPYRFLLRAVHRLSPREVPEAIDEIDPLSRGKLLHEVQFELLRELQQAGRLPLSVDGLDHARARLEEILQRVAARWRDELSPAIPRIWDDSIAGMGADLREWLRRLAEAPQWVPWRFELSFGLPDLTEHDPHSTKDPVVLDEGLRLRGSIDLVERRSDGGLRATDYKSGKQRADPGVVIGGGSVLQPALYALALQKLFPDAKVQGGRLYYNTFAAGFTPVEVPLDELVRSSIRELSKTLSDAIAGGFLPAAPDEGECKYCDFQPVCGPAEERRTRLKPRDLLQPLTKLREMP